MSRDWRDLHFGLTAGGIRRLNWLLKNPTVWQGMAGTDDDIYALFGQMQTAGLYSFSTIYGDARSSIGKLLKKAKRTKG